MTEEDKDKYAEEFQCFARRSTKCKESCWRRMASCAYVNDGVTSFALMVSMFRVLPYLD